MKKLSLLLLVLFATISLAACDGVNLDGDKDKENNDNTPTVTENDPELTTDLASATFISQGLLSSSTNSTVTYQRDTHVMKLSTAQNMTTEASIESRMEQMMTYLDIIEVFLDGSPEEVLNVEHEESTKEGYSSQISYQIEGVTYNVYYNVVNSDEDNTLEEGEFTLEGILEYSDLSFNVNGGAETSATDGEIELWYETVDPVTDDYVRVEVYKDAFEQYFEIDSYMNGLDSYSEIRMEKDGLDGAVEIYIDENDMDYTYEITKEVDGNSTIFYFEYSVGDVYGSIEMTVTIDSEGNEVRHFIIEEGDYYREYTEGISDDDA
ncbi:hypothetical protein BK011_03695 [Tenericutes bacterium MZ-XQ]|nr:hypothetical protein BK011_03695 [Tenericutes bacterium MZ-XQ]